MLILFWILVSIFIIGLFVPKFRKHPVTQTADKTMEGIHMQGCFYRMNDKIYCGSKNSILPDVDIDTFQVISHLVAKDNNNVYVIDRIYPDLDARTFNKYSKDGLSLHYLYSDKNGIYNLGLDNKLVPLNLDIDTATNIDRFYIKDKDGVYFSNYSITKINDADPETFHILGGCASVEKSYTEYAADKNHVFVGNQIIPGIDPSQFVQIAKITSKDEEIPYSFFLWKDTKNIYVYCGTIIKEADYETFEYRDGRAQDKNNYYNFNTGGGNYIVMPKK